jgi:acetyl esterase/lipase
MAAALLAWSFSIAAMLLPTRPISAPVRAPVRAARLASPRAAHQQEDTPWPTDLTSHVVSGIKLAVAEARETGGVVGAMRASARIANLVLNELFVFPVKMLPFALRTVRYRSPNVELIESPQLEVYHNPRASDGPLVLYFHGGSWGQGAPWQYALLARRLLEEGGASRVAVAKYRLFPAGDVRCHATPRRSHTPFAPRQDVAARRTRRATAAARPAALSPCARTGG